MTVKIPKNLEEWGNQLLENVRQTTKAAIEEARAQGNAEAVAEAETEHNRQVSAVQRRLEQAKEREDAWLMPSGARDGDEEFDLGNVVRALLKQHHEGVPYERTAPFEYAVNLEYRQQLRAQGVVTDDKGGFLVPGQVLVDRIIEPLLENGFLGQLGVQEINLTTTPIDIPTVETLPDAAGANENEALSEGEATFGNRRVEPYDCGVAIRGSRQFMNMGAGASAMIERVIRSQLDRKLTRWALKGAGPSQKEPVGVLNLPGLPTVDFSSVNAAQPSKDLYDALLAMEESLMANNIFEDDLGSARWLSARKAARTFRQLHDQNASAGTPSMSFARKVLSDRRDTSLLGWPYRITNYLSDGTNAEILFGDWSRLWWCHWGTFNLEATTQGEGTFLKRQVLVAGWLSTDFLAEHAAAFVASSGYDTSGI